MQLNSLAKYELRSLIQESNEGQIQCKKFLLSARVSVLKLITEVQRSCPALLRSELTTGSAFPAEFQQPYGVQVHTTASRMRWSFAVQLHKPPASLPLWSQPPCGLVHSLKL